MTAAEFVARHEVWRRYAVAGFGELVVIAWANPPESAADLAAPYAALVDAMVDADLARAGGMAGRISAQAEAPLQQAWTEEREPVTDAKPDLSDHELLAAARQLFVPGQMVEAAEIVRNGMADARRAAYIVDVMESAGITRGGIMLYVMADPLLGIRPAAPAPEPEPLLADGEGTPDDPLWFEALGCFNSGQFVSPATMVAKLGITRRRADALRNAYEAAGLTTHGVR